MYFNSAFLALMVAAQIIPVMMSSRVDASP